MDIEISNPRPPSFEELKSISSTSKTIKNRNKIIKRAKSFIKADDNANAPIKVRTDIELDLKCKSPQCVEDLRISIPSGRYKMPDIDRQNVLEDNNRERPEIVIRKRARKSKSIKEENEEYQKIMDSALQAMNAAEESQKKLKDNLREREERENIIKRKLEAEIWELFDD